MTKVRTRASAVLAALLLTVAASIAVGVFEAAPATAASTCPSQVYLGTIKSGLSNYLDDYGGGNGSYVHTYQLTSSSNQTWCVERASEVRGGYFIHPLNDPTGLCLHADQNTPGYPLKVATCDGTTQQRWCWNGHGYIVRWDASQLALKDSARYSIVQLAQGGATQWYTAGTVLGGNC
jgi:hypothetical protein